MNSHFRSTAILTSIAAASAIFLVQHDSHAGSAYMLTAVSFDAIANCDTWSACDIKWEAEVDGKIICRGAKKQDDNHPRWTGFSCSGLVQGDWLTITFYDVDMTATRSLGGCRSRVTKATSAGCSGTDWTSTHTIESDSD